eukprot:g81077.t1
MSEEWDPDTPRPIYNIESGFQCDTFSQMSSQLKLENGWVVYRALMTGGKVNGKHSFCYADRANTNAAAVPEIGNKVDPSPQYLQLRIES